MLAANERVRCRKQEQTEGSKGKLWNLPATTKGTDASLSLDPPGRRAFSSWFASGHLPFHAIPIHWSLVWNSFSMTYDTVREKFARTNQQRFALGYAPADAERRNNAEDIALRAHTSRIESFVAWKPLPFNLEEALKTILMWMELLCPHQHRHDNQCTAQEIF